MAIYWQPGFKGRTFQLCALTRWDFNFCVRSSPLRGGGFGGGEVSSDSRDWVGDKSIETDRTGCAREEGSQPPPLPDCSTEDRSVFRHSNCVLPSFRYEQHNIPEELPYTVPSWRQTCHKMADVIAVTSFVIPQTGSRNHRVTRLMYTQPELAKAEKSCETRWSFSENRRSSRHIMPFTKPPNALILFLCFPKQ